MFNSSVKLRIKQATDENPFIPVYCVVVSALKHEIFCYHILPGTHLKEKSTAEELDVSRSTVRRAFDMLVLEGVLIRDEFKGVTVAPLRRDLYNSIVELRMMLDPYSAALAAQRRSKKDLEEMQRFMNLYVSAQKLEERARHDAAFHNVIYKASGNPFISQVSDDYEGQILRCRHLSGPGISSMFTRIIEEHQEIYSAIARKDPVAAEKNARQHVSILMEAKVLTSYFMTNFA